MIQHLETLDFPLPLAVLDFETYYSQDYSLTKLTTEEYVRDPRFEIIMAGLILPTGERVVIKGSMAQIKRRLEEYPIHEWAVVCHNTMFDAAIATWHLGVKPALWLDTLSMARAYGMMGKKGYSLKALADHFGLKAKGGYVMNMLGVHACDMTPDMWDRYEEYCLDDCDITLHLFNALYNGWYSINPPDKRDPFPRNELLLIDTIIRMFSEPVFSLSLRKLSDHLTNVRQRKQDLLDRCGATPEILQSSAKFAALLNTLGVEAPKKISLTTGKETYALAKTDQGMKDLLEHENELVQALAAARLGVKSTLEESRTARFMGIAGRGPLPIPLSYGVTISHRLAGADKINLQNLPSRGANANSIKKCMEVPEDHSAIDSDSSNIEARGVAWLAEQDDLVQAFARGEDTYSNMASGIYGRPINKHDDPEERFVGKEAVLGCLAGHTQVLTDSGWKAIVSVLPADKLWDGEAWVTHSGLLEKGIRPVLSKWGLTATSDHEILTERGWREWQEVRESPSLMLSATSLVNSPSCGGNHTTQTQDETPDIIPCAGALVGGRGWSSAKTSRRAEVRGVTPARSKKAQPPERCTGATLPYCRTTTYGKAFLTGLQTAFRDARDLLTKTGRTMVVAELESTLRGLRIGRSSCGTSYRCPDGTTELLTSTGSTTLGGTNLGIFDSPHERRMRLTGAPSKNSKQRPPPSVMNCETYDIALSGPNNRFTVMTDLGPILVHNCGYGMGWAKFQGVLKSKKNMAVSEEFARKVISTYRETYYKIPELWRCGEDALRWMASDQQGWLGREGVVLVDGLKGLRLPNGLYIQYTNLRRDEEGWVYDNGRKGVTRIYGAKIVENVTQALARIIVMWQLVQISRKYKVALTVHDAICIVVPDADRVEAESFVSKIMRTAPKWAAGWPLDCEWGVGKSYGDC